VVRVSDNFWLSVIHVRGRISKSFPYAVLYFLGAASTVASLVFSVWMFTTAYWWIGFLGLLLTGFFFRVTWVSLEYSTDITVFGSPQNPYRKGNQ
jgi:hypothetical protein